MSFWNRNTTNNKDSLDLKIEDLRTEIQGYKHQRDLDSLRNKSFSIEQDLERMRENIKRVKSDILDEMSRTEGLIEDVNYMSSSFVHDYEDAKKEMKRKKSDLEMDVLEFNRKLGELQSRLRNICRKMENLEGFEHGYSDSGQYGFYPTKELYREIPKR
ncbi:MAG: hypothetical protein AAFZ15_33300 [Bacteroidota bacterium]